MTTLEAAFIRGFVKRASQLLGGGKGADPKTISPKELAKGVKTEKEHTPKPHLAKEIALDHLDEDKHYYTKLLRAKL